LPVGSTVETLVPGKNQLIVQYRPIHTYQKRGVLKPGLQTQDHAIIYSSDKPVRKDGEYLIKKSIKVKIDNPRDKLAPESRLNYAKIYVSRYGSFLFVTLLLQRHARIGKANSFESFKTIEFNVKVHFIGRVHNDHEQRLYQDYIATQNLGSPGGTFGGRSSTIAEETSGVGQQWEGEEEEEGKERRRVEDY